MRWIPADVLASWPIPNYVDPPTNPLVYVVYSFMAVFLALSTVAVFARLYARIRFRNWFSWDDFFLLLAYCAEIGVTTVLLLGYTRYGWSRHIYDVDPANLTPSAKIFFSLKIVWPIASCFTRISLIFFYYRILDHIQIRKYRWVLHFTMFIVWGILITFMFTTIFDCVPVSAYWVFPPVPNQSCINENVAFTLLSALNTFSELIVALLPIPVVLKLKMDTRQRIGVISILSLGFFVAIVGAVRTYYVYKALETYDLTWYATPHTIAAILEVDLGIIFACAPALRPLFRSGRETLSRTSPSSRQPSQTSTEKDDRTSSRSRVTTARSRNTEASGWPVEKPPMPVAFRSDSAQSRVTPPTRSRASPAIGSASNLPGRRSTTTPISNRSRYTTGQPQRPSPPLYARRISHTPSDGTSISSEDEVANRKSLEIQISYQDNGSDLRSLYVQPSRFLAREEEDRRSSNPSVSDDGRAARQHASWLAGKELLAGNPLQARRPTQGSDTSSSDGGYNDKDLEKGIIISDGRDYLQVPGNGDGEQESVSLSDFDFEPRPGSDGGGSTASPVLSGELSPLPEFPTYRTQPPRQTPNENLLFVRHSLSTIASSNLLRPNPAATAAAVAAAAAAAADNRSSINRSINTYDSRTRSGVFGSGTADIRNTLEIARPSTATGVPEPESSRIASPRTRSTEVVDWWGRYTSPAETAPPQEATMWGYAFDRVFGKNKRVSDLGEQDSSNGTTNDSSLGLNPVGSNNNGRTREQSPPLDSNQFVEGNRFRQSNVGTVSTASTENKRGSCRGMGGTWFDDAASI